MRERIFGAILLPKWLRSPQNLRDFTEDKLIMLWVECDNVLIIYERMRLSDGVARVFCVPSRACVGSKLETARDPRTVVCVM